MKYSQACQVKALVERSITSLEAGLRDGKITGAGKRRLAAAYVRLGPLGQEHATDELDSGIERI